MSRDVVKTAHLKNHARDAVTAFIQENGYDQRNYNSFKNQILDIISDTWQNNGKFLWTLVLQNRIMETVLSHEYVQTLTPHVHDGAHFSQSWTDEELLHFIGNDKNRFDRVKKTLLEKVILEYEYIEKAIFGSNLKGAKGNKADEDRQNYSSSTNQNTASHNAPISQPFTSGRQFLNTEPLPTFYIENVICALSDKDKSEMEEIRKSTPQGLISLVDKCMKSFQDGAHDLQHCFRVANLALEISFRERNHIKQVGGRRKKNIHWATSENDVAVSDFNVAIDHKVIFIAGLCHDILDTKFQSSENIASMEEELLSALQNPSDYNCLTPTRANHILTIVKNVGYKYLSKKLVDPYTLTLEYQCVQDADLLDAIGAIGIARCYAYGGKFLRPLFGGIIPEPINITPEQYLANTKKSNATSGAADAESSSKHFFDKLFKIKDLMITYSGYQLALPRHHMMIEYLKQVDVELNEGKYRDAGIMTEKIYKEKIIDISMINSNKRFRQF